MLHLTEAQMFTNAFCDQNAFTAIDHSARNELCAALSLSLLSSGLVLGGLLAAQISLLSLFSPALQKHDSSVLPNPRTLQKKKKTTLSFQSFRDRSTPDGRCCMRSHVTNVLSPVHAPVVTQLLLCALIIHRPLGLDWKKTRLHSGINLCTLRAPIFSSRPLSIIRSRVATSMTDLKMARDCLATVSEKRLSNPCIIARGQRLAPADISRRVVFRLELPWDKTCLLTTGQR